MLKDKVIEAKGSDLKEWSRVGGTVTDTKSLNLLGYN